MLDRIDAGQHRVAGGLVAVAVAGDLLAQPVGLVAKGGHLGEGELRRVDLVRQRQHAARRAELDHVGPVLDLVANRRREAVRAAGDPFGLMRLRKQIMPEPALGRHARRSAPRA